MENVVPGEARDDPYRPPEAEVATGEPLAAASGEPPPFFQVSPLKLAVMALATGGLYEVYWFYRHWRQVGRWETHELSPLARAVFSPLFAYSLFAKPSRLAFLREIDLPPAPSGALTAGYLAAVLSGFLQWPVSLLNMLTVLPLLAFQRRINDLLAGLGHDPRANSRFTVWNVLWILAGGGLWAFVVIGALGSSPPP